MARNNRDGQTKGRKHVVDDEDMSWWHGLTKDAATLLAAGSAEVPAHPQTGRARRLAIVSSVGASGGRRSELGSAESS